MAEYTPKQRRRGLEFANQIAALAAKAPDDISKRALHAAAQNIRQLHGFSYEEKKKMIMKSLALGCSTYDDLVGETQLPKTKVYEIIQALEEEGVVERRMLLTGEMGRPMVYIHVLQNK